MMYRILYNKVEIYGNDLDQAVLNPTLEVELNAAGKLEFTLPVTRSDTVDDNGNKIFPDTIWRNIQVFNGEVEVWEGDECIFFGRPLQIIRDWNNQKRVVCEGALAYFNDTIQETKEYKQKKNPLYTDNEKYPNKTGFFNQLISNHNDQMMKDNQYDLTKSFEVGECNLDNPLVWRKTDMETTASCLQSMCLDTNGGYFILRKEKVEGTVDDYKNVIDWKKNPPYGTSQEIIFGLNILDMSQDLNGSDICTVLYPTADDDIDISKADKHEEDNPYVIHHDPEDHREDSHIYHDKSAKYMVHKEGYEKYGRVVKQKSFDLESEGTEKQMANELFVKAAEWLDDQNYDETTIECSAADLHYVWDQTPYYVEGDDPPGKLGLGQLVRVTDEVHGVTRELPIFKISMNLDSGVKKITMGTPPKKELTDIIKPSTSSSTRNTTGGNADSGGSSSGSGGGGGSVSIPVKDVQVKTPGSNEYASTVKKKISKIDLNEAVLVADVKVDGISVVDEHKVANIEAPVKDVTQDGVSVVNPETGIANIVSPNVPVKDVKVDGQTVVDANGFAQLLSNDFGKVKGVMVNGSSVVNPETGIATLNGYVDGYQVTFDYMHHIYYWQKQIVIPSGENWFIQDSDIKSRINATYYPETKSLNFDLTDVFQRAITWGPGFDSFYANLGSDPAYHDLDDKVDGNYIVYARFHYDGFRINDDGIGLDVQDYEYKNDLVRKYFKLDFLSGAGIDIKASSDRFMSTYKYADTEGFHIKISSTEAKSKPHCEEEFHDYSEYAEGSNSDSVSHLISESGTYAILFMSAYTSTQEIVFENLSGSIVTPTTTYYNYSNTFSVPGESGKGGKCITIVCDLEAGTVVKFNRTKSSGYKENIVLRSITSLSNVSMATTDILISRDNYTKTLTRSSSSDAHTNRSTSYADTGSVNICGSIAFDCADSSSAYVKTTAKTTQYHLDPQYYYDRDPFSITTYNRSDSSKIDASVVYDNGPVGSSRDWNDAERASCDSFLCSANDLATNNDKAYVFQFFVTLKATKYDDSDVGYVTETEMTDAIDDAVSTLESNFQDGVDAIYDACVAKGSTPASQSLSDVVQGIMDIPQSGGGGDTIKFTSSSHEDSDFNQVRVTSTWDATGLSFISEVTT